MYTYVEPWVEGLGPTHVVANRAGNRRLLTLLPSEVQSDRGWPRLLAGSSGHVRVGVEGGRPWVVEDLPTGIRLDRWIAAGWPFSAADAFDVARTTFMARTPYVSDRRSTTFSPRIRFVKPGPEGWLRIEGYGLWARGLDHTWLESLLGPFEAPPSAGLEELAAFVTTLVSDPAPPLIAKWLERMRAHAYPNWLIALAEMDFTLRGPEPVRPEPPFPEHVAILANPKGSSFDDGYATRFAHHHEPVDPVRAEKLQQYNTEIQAYQEAHLRWARKPPSA